MPRGQIRTRESRRRLNQKCFGSSDEEETQRKRKQSTYYLVVPVVNCTVEYLVVNVGKAKK